MSLVDYPFIFRGSRHSLSTCFELSGSSSSGDHFPVQSASGIVCNLCCSPPVLVRENGRATAKITHYTRGWLYREMIS